MFIPLTPIRFLHRAMDLYGAKTGVVCGTREFTYADFGERCERLADALGLEGVEAGDRVAYLSLNTHKLLEGYFGVPQARAVLTPLNVRLAPAELVHLLNHAGAKVLIFEKDFAPLVARLRLLCPAITRFVGADDSAEADLSYEELIASGKPRRADIFSYDENSIAELFYTGGATGTPKGVTLSHRTLYLHALSGGMLAREPETAVDLYTIPLFHANGWGHPQIGTMLGIKQVMVRRFEPVNVLRLIDEYQATEMTLIPVMAQMLLNVSDAQSFVRTSMRDIHIGGAPCPQPLIAAMERLFPNARCVTGYGLTETAPFLSYPPPGKAGEDDVSRRARQGSFGWPVMGASLRIVDDHMQDVPRDGTTIGEIVAMGDNVMDSYFRDAELAAAAFFGPWLRTGDLGVWKKDGTMQIVDRSKDLIISGGENISSLEVESAIAGHPAVLECAVIGVPDEKWGEVPIAIVVGKPGAIFTKEDLLVFLRERLTRFKMPRDILIRTEPLPRSGTLKVQKALLRQQYRAS
jgi:fatty-acyl-CoA synthase